MFECYTWDLTENAVPILPIIESDFDAFLKKQDQFVQNWLSQTDFVAKPSQVCLLPDEKGNLDAVLIGTHDLKDIWLLGSLALTLPYGDYFLDANVDDHVLQQMCMGWGLGAYQYTRYKAPERKPACLVLPKNCDAAVLENTVEAIYLVRDLINTPAEDMMPFDLVEISKLLAEHYDAHFNCYMEEDVLSDLFPGTVAVGMGSMNQSVVIDLNWGDEKAPKVTIIGKGVCFDSGGLNLKSTASMASMKKDMGGAACAIGLAKMIMAAHLPIQLRLLIPAVENLVSSDAYKPGDVITMRNTKTVEVTNTDAEGRLILADALIEAQKDPQDLVIDFATLTGAARVALGPQIAAMFTNRDALAQEITAFAQQEKEPVWRMPLYEPYADWLKSDIADLANSSKEPYAGAITAALFLKAFVKDETPWVHFDIMGANTETNPGRPKGGEAFLLRTLFSYLRHRYSARH